MADVSRANSISPSSSSQGYSKAVLEEAAFFGKLWETEGKYGNNLGKFASILTDPSKKEVIRRFYNSLSPAEQENFYKIAIKGVYGDSPLPPFLKPIITILSESGGTNPGIPSSKSNKNVIPASADPNIAHQDIVSITPQVDYGAEAKKAWDSTPLPDRHKIAKFLKMPIEAITPEILLDKAVFLKAHFPGLNLAETISHLSVGRAADLRSATSPTPVSSGQVNGKVFVVDGNFYRIFSYNDGKSFALVRMEQKGDGKFERMRGVPEIELIHIEKDVPLPNDIRIGDNKRIAIQWEGTNQPVFYLQQPAKNKYEIPTLLTNKSEFRNRVFDAWRADLSKPQQGLFVHIRTAGMPFPSGRIPAALNLNGMLVLQSPEGLYIYSADIGSVYRKAFSLTEHLRNQGLPVQCSIERVNYQYNPKNADNVFDGVMANLRQSGPATAKNGTAMVWQDGGKQKIYLRTEGRFVAPEYVEGNHLFRLLELSSGVEVDGKRLDLKLLEMPVEQLAQIEPKELKTLIERLGKGKANFAKRYGNAEDAWLRTMLGKFGLEPKLINKKCAEFRLARLEQEFGREVANILKNRLTAKHGAIKVNLESKHFNLDQLISILIKYREGHAGINEKGNDGGLKEKLIQARDAKIGAEQSMLEEAGMRELKRALTPEKVKNFIDYLKKPEGRALLETERGKELLAVMRKLSQAKNFAQAFKLEGAGLIAGLIVLVGVEKFADLIGLENKQARLVLVLGVSHFANLKVQEALVKKILGQEAAGALKIATIIENPTVMGRLRLQFKNVMGGLAAMTFVSRLCDKVLDLAGVKDMKTKEIATLALATGTTAAANFTYGRVVAKLGEKAAPVIAMRAVGLITKRLGVASLLTDGLMSILAKDYLMHVNKRAYDYVQSQRAKGSAGSKTAFVVAGALNFIAGKMHEGMVAQENPEVTKYFIDQDIDEANKYRAQLKAELAEFIKNGGDIQLLGQEYRFGTIKIPTGATRERIVKMYGDRIRMIEDITEDIPEEKVFISIVKYGKKYPFGSQEHIKAVRAEFGYMITSADVARVLDKGVLISWQTRIAFLHTVQPSLFGSELYPKYNGSTFNNDIRSTCSAQGVVRDTTNFVL